MAETERVVQLWPVEIKQALRERVGTRGMTAYTLAAVHDRMAQEGLVPPREERQRTEHHRRPRPEPVVAAPTEPTCATCGSELVAGECWNCP